MFPDYISSSILKHKQLARQNVHDNLRGEIHHSNKTSWPAE